METTNKKVWIRGNAEHPEKVIEALGKYGSNMYNTHGENPDHLYYINIIGCIEHTSAYSTLGEMLMQYGEELFPEPEYKFKVGDKVKHKKLDRVETITELVNAKGKPAYRTAASTLTEEQIELYTEPQIKTWEDYEAQATSEGLWGISGKGNVTQYTNPTQAPVGRCFATERAAKSALAMAKISQLMPYYGGEITDEEWEDDEVVKYIIRRRKNEIYVDWVNGNCYFLTFRTEAQCNDFYKNNRQLVYDYLMID